MQMLQPHIRLAPDPDLRCAILPGDPARIDRILPFLEDARELMFNREYRSVSGWYKGVKILALSTGIGGTSMGIAVEELHKIGITHAVRIGSAGALQNRIGIGDLIFAAGAVRDDGASKSYVPTEFPAIPDPALLQACLSAARERQLTHHVGIVRSHDSFYTDQEQELCEAWSARGVLGSDMETAALFTIGALRGMKTASILNNVVLYQADTAEGIGEYGDGDAMAAAGERAEIEVALEALAKVMKDE